ncbi:MAG: hypothetical protein QM747_04270 [Nocardioides sp.]
MSDSDELRRMVREVLREVLPRDGAPAPVPHDAPGAPAARDDVRRVRVRDDRDLADLVTQVVDLAEDPARVADLRAGRIRFVLVTDDASAAPAAATPIEVERGAVTERADPACGTRAATAAHRTASSGHPPRPRPGPSCSESRSTRKGAR